MLEKRACNVENMTKLYNALISGDYKQIRHRLKIGNAGFCCLGVGCDVSGLGRWTDNDEYLIGYKHERYALPGAVTRWLGITGDSDDKTALILIENSEGDTTAAGLNDQGCSFADIAEMIKKVYLPDD